MVFNFYVEKKFIQDEILTKISVNLFTSHTPKTPIKVGIDSQLYIQIVTFKCIPNLAYIRDLTPPNQYENHEKKIS